MKKTNIFEFKDLEVKIGRPLASEICHFGGYDFSVFRIQTSSKDGKWDDFYEVRSYMIDGANLFVIDYEHCDRRLKDIKIEVTSENKHILKGITDEVSEILKKYGK